jgi:hypothetical protein
MNSQGFVTTAGLTINAEIWVNPQIVERIGLW